jgi:hypothetical protein
MGKLWFASFRLQIAMADTSLSLLGTVPLEPVDRKPLNRLALTENTCFLR